MRVEAPESVAVLGAGGVGGLVAAALARPRSRAERTPRVVVVARRETAKLIAAGLVVSSATLGDFVARPVVEEELAEEVDVLVVATKASALPAALERIRARPALVVPLLNGIEHLQMLRGRWGRRVVAAVIRVESDRPEPGRIVHTSRFLRIDLASDDRGVERALAPVAAMFRAAGIEVTIGPSEADVMWRKLTRLNALACTTSAYDLPLGPIRDDPERNWTLEQAVAETAAVARAEGAREVWAGAVMAELAEAHAGLTSSMQRDLAAGRETELDAIAGAVLRAAARHGLVCPTVERLAAEVQGRSAAAATGRSSP